MARMKSALLFAAVITGALPAQADPALRAQALQLFGRLEAPAPAAIASPEVELGRRLFWDERISLDGKTSCGSCHLDHGADKRPFSPDARGALTSRHSPTVFNSMGQPSMRWLGDRKNGAEQAEGSLTGSLGFADKKVALEKLREHGYADAFKAAYPEEAQAFTTANYGKALQAYQATLVTPAPFDRWLAGEEKALDARQVSGLRAFIATGCAACHNGALAGGTQFVKFGMVKDYWSETGSRKPDVGRVAFTKDEADKYFFRVPMLRNVASTAPYFHDGSVGRLDQAVRVMASVQLGRTLDEATVASIVAFLGSLTGPVPAHYAPPEGR
jgi:cytochrome c peroxidase